jgi:hypothetical protein
MRHLVLCRSLWTHVYRQLAWYYMVAKSIEDDYLQVVYLLPIFKVLSSDMNQAEIRLIQ